MIMIEDSFAISLDLKGLFKSCVGSKIIPAISCTRFISIYINLPLIDSLLCNSW